MPRKTKPSRLPHQTQQMASRVNNPVWAAFAKNPVGEDTRIAIGLAARQSLHAMQNGYGEVSHYKELHIAVHSAIVLAEYGYGADLMQDFESALRAMTASRRRAEQGQALGFDVEEGQTVGLMVDLHEQQVGMASQAEVTKSILEGFKRIISVTDHG